MSSPRNLVILGGGEHARVVIEAARSKPELWNVIGFLDPKPCEKTVRELGVPRLGDDSRCAELAASAGACFVLGAGGFEERNLRERIAERIDREGLAWASIVHVAAWVSPSAKIGPGAVVFAGAIVQASAEIGRHGIVNSQALVEHDVRVGDYSHVGPAAAIGGGCAVGRGALLGLGCRVRDHLRIGDRATVGMGAVVVENVGEGQTVVGVPAKPLVKA